MKLSFSNFRNYVGISDLLNKALFIINITSNHLVFSPKLVHPASTHQNRFIINIFWSANVKRT